MTADQITAGGEMKAEEKSVADQCHIYVVCRRPSLRFDPTTFNHENEQASGNLIYYIEGKEHRVPFARRFPLLDGAVSCSVSPYPHREMRTHDENGSEVRHMPASMLSILEQHHSSIRELADLEVLYIGQSFASGNRSAFERLQSHSTLQKILADASYENPDTEIFVATFKYEPYRVVTIFDGRAKDVIRDKRDSNRFYSIIDHPLKQSQQVSLAEAALIRYFEPRYNKIYKSNFPSKNHKVLASCYELDFSGLTVEINTEELGFRLFSERAKPSSHHISSVELLSHTNRAGFFFFSDGSGEVKKLVPTIG